MKGIKKNIKRFFQSDTPIVSDRVRVILSSPEDSEKLAEAVRDKRRDPEKTISFKLSADTNKKIKNLEY